MSHYHLEFEVRSDVSVTVGLAIIIRMDTSRDVLTVSLALLPTGKDESVLGTTRHRRKGCIIQREHCQLVVGTEASDSLRVALTSRRAV